MKARTQFFSTSEREKNTQAGSRNLPLDEIDKVDSVIKDKNTPLYVHCLSGGRSARAAAYLKDKGYREVHDIGGIGSYRGKIVV